MIQGRRFGALALALLMLIVGLSGCAAKPVNRDSDLTSVTAAPTTGITAGDTTESGRYGSLIPQVNRSESPAVKPFTLMVYMVGSNLESAYGAASTDLMEMVNSGLLGTNANLLVYTGGSSSWDLGIRSDVNTVFALDDAGTTLMAVATTEGPLNTGDPTTLSDFINYATANYPAQNYGLVCWDHGGGPVGGFGSDELFGGDRLWMYELQAALDATLFAQQKLSFVGFDACLMGSLEVAAVMSRYADFMVASEEVEPGDGWNYSALNILNTTSDPQMLASSILTAYQQDMENSYWLTEYSLGCYDLRNFAQQTAILDNTWYALAAHIVNGGYNDVAMARNEAKRLGVTTADLSNSYDLVDAKDLVSRTGLLNEAEFAFFEGALNALVPQHVTNIAGANGLSLYFPYDNMNLYQNGGEGFDRGELMQGVSQLVRAFMTGEYTAPSTTPIPVPTLPPVLEVTPLPVDTSGHAPEEPLIIIAPEWEFDLEYESPWRSGPATAYYSILRYDEEAGGYFPLLLNKRASVDSEGKVLIPEEQNLYVLSADVPGDTLICPASFLENSSSYDKYVTDRTMLLTSTDVLGGDYEVIQVFLAEDGKTGDVAIQNITPFYHEDAILVGREETDISHWGLIGVGQQVMTPVYEEGRLAPMKDWEEERGLYIHYSNYDEDFTFHAEPLTEQEGDFYCYVELRSPTGAILSTSLEPFCKNIPYTVETLSDDNMDLVFHVYRDHALLYEASKKADAAESFALTIPETVMGKPVTEIDQNAVAFCSALTAVTLPDTVTTVDAGAFQNCLNLSSVTLPASVVTVGDMAFENTALTTVDLPEGLQVLGADAFASTDLTQLTLPASLEYLGEGAFSYCNNLKTIEVQEGNGKYQSLDGVLFSLDGTKLIAYPAARSTSYSLPEGTVEIAASAFCGNTSLTSITLPEGLKVIDRRAFCDTGALTALQLPSSLEILGSDAFGESAGKPHGTNLGTVTIGANVSWIGSEAFAGYKIEGFEVAEENKHYAAREGFLMNAGATKLLQVPTALTGAVTVPEGVNRIEDSSLLWCDEITELTLPDSVLVIDDLAFFPAGLQKLTIGRQLMDWQNLPSCAEIPEIVIHPENPYYSMDDAGNIVKNGEVVLERKGNNN